MARVFCSSDWHGCGKVAKKVLNYLQPDDILYFLGDVTDRGEDGVELLDLLMSRPNTYYIKGNHDDMMVRTLPYMIKDMQEIECCEFEKYPDQTWYINGAWSTIEKLVNKSVEDLIKYKNFLSNLPTELKYESPAGHLVILEHAGYTPFDIPHRSHDPLWDREHFYDIWGGFWNREKYVPYTPKNTYLVHGHTPVQYLKYRFGYKGEKPFTKEDFIGKRQFLYDDYLEDEPIILPKILRYCDGHKFDVDMCTIASGRIALLDLDTFEEIYFDEEEGVR